MALTSGFYNSLNGDRKYDALQMGSLFDGIIEDGVYRAYGTAFELKATTGLTITVGIGRAWFRHTWTLNDALLSLTLSASHATLPRYDEVVIEVDTSEAVRANSIKVVQGTAASSPVRPTLTNTTQVRQYSLGYIYRAPGGTVILQSDINATVGSLETPYATSVLATSVSLFTQFDSSGSSAMHRTVYRGKNLGGTLTANQKTAIQNGSFDDLWLGDYWVIGGVNWRIVDINYWYGLGDTAFNKNHLVVMPDTTLYNAKMHGTATTSTGYGGSQMRTTNLNTAKTTINAAFPSAVLTHRDVFASQIVSGDIEETSWYNATVEIPNERMVYGSSLYGHEWNSISTQQLALFSVVPKFKKPANLASMWLNPNSNDTDYCGMYQNGASDYFTANDTLGVRPVFAVGV